MASKSRFATADLGGIIPPITTPFTAIAAILTAAPHACVRLWDAVRAGDHGSALRLHGRLLKLWNAMHADMAPGSNNLPAATKCALTLQGLKGGAPRAPMPAASQRQQKAIAGALKALT